MPASIETFNPELLKGIAPGQWVAISADQKRVAGAGSTLQEALAKAKESGDQNPFIIRIPIDKSALIL